MVIGVGNLNFAEVLDGGQVMWPVLQTDLMLYERAQAIFTTVTLNITEPPLTLHFVSFANDGTAIRAASTLAAGSSTFRFNCLGVLVPTGDNPARVQMLGECDRPSGLGEPPGNFPTNYPAPIYLNIASLRGTGTYTAPANARVVAFTHRPGKMVILPTWYTA